MQVNCPNDPSVFSGWSWTPKEFPHKLFEHIPKKNITVHTITQQSEEGHFAEITLITKTTWTTLQAEFAEKFTQMYLSENWMRSRCCHHFWVQILPCWIPLQRPRPLSCFWSPLTNSMQVIQSQAWKWHWGVVANVFTCSYLPTSANHSKSIWKAGRGWNFPLQIQTKIQIPLTFTSEIEEVLFPQKGNFIS